MAETVIMWCGGSLNQKHVMKKLVIIAAMALLSLPAISKEQCKATTKKGEPCARSGSEKYSGYCYSHDPKAVKCTGKTKAGEQCKLRAGKNSPTCHIHNKG
jgi:hypothetical protein